MSYREYECTSAARQTLFTFAGFYGGMTGAAVLIGNKFFPAFRAISWRPKAMITAMAALGLGYLESEQALNRCRAQQRLADLDRNLASSANQSNGKKT